MPGSYLIDSARRIVFSRGWGVVTDEEVLMHAQALHADPRFEPGLQQLVDFRDIQEFQMTTPGVRQVAQRNPFRQDARRAFVVGEDHVFGMVRMYSAFAESDPNQFRVFRTLWSALKWIGLDETTPWPTETPDGCFGSP